jgi:hypothetical protein
MSSSTRRDALTLRGLGRAYGLDRHFLGSLVRRGELPALRRGRALLVLVSDFEHWWHSQAVSPDKLAEQVVAARLEREARSSTPTG